MLNENRNPSSTSQNNFESSDFTKSQCLQEKMKIWEASKY